MILNLINLDLNMPDMLLVAVSFNARICINNNNNICYMKIVRYKINY